MGRNGDIGEAVSALPHRAYKILQDVARRQVRKCRPFNEDKRPFSGPRSRVISIPVYNSNTSTMALIQGPLKVDG